MTIRLLRSLAGLHVVLALTASAGAADLSVQVDLRKQGGPVPYTYRAGVFLNSLPVGYPKDTFLAEQRPGMVEFSWDFYDLLLNAASEEEFFSRLPGSNLTAWVRDTAAAGGEPYVRLMPIPRWLWSGSNGARRAPADWEGWERFVERIVRYFNNQLGIDVRYIVWDEPDLAWEGTTQEFLRLYLHSATGLLRANPKARIGGPAPAAFHAPIKNGPSLLPEFVRYCANTSIPGLARRLPIDMLVWHTFDAAPTSPGLYDVEVETARKLLESHGYRDRVELNVGSWAVLGRYPEIGNERDSHVLAAFFVSSVIAMTRAGVDRHAFFTLFEDWRRNRDEFSNDMGLATRNFVMKAGYYGSALLSRLQGRHVPVTLADPSVQMAVAHDTGTLRVLVANFPAPRRMLMGMAVQRLVARGYSREQLKTMLPEPEKLLRNRASIEAWGGPPEVRAEMLAMHDAAVAANRRQKETVSIRVMLDGLPAGRYRLREYRIDDSSGNPLSRREDIEQALRQASMEGRALARDYLAKRWNPADMAKLASIQKGGGGLPALMRDLPPERQQELREAMALANEPPQRRAKAINAAAQPRAQELPESQVSGTLSWQAALPPYGVVLLEAERLN